MSAGIRRAPAGAVVVVALLAACAGPTSRPERVPLGEVQDVLEGTSAQLAALVGEWPVTVLVGEAGGLDAVLAARAALASRAPGGELLTIVDAVGLDVLQRTALDTALVEAALEDGGPLLIDDGDGVARRLAGLVDRPTLVRIERDGEVLARVAVPGADEAALAGIFAGE